MECNNKKEKETREEKNNRMNVDLEVNITLFFYQNGKSWKGNYENSIHVNWTLPSVGHFCLFFFFFDVRSSVWEWMLKEKESHIKERKRLDSNEKEEMSK